jgi:hypothetical protein
MMMVDGPATIALASLMNERFGADMRLGDL